MRSCVHSSFFAFLVASLLASCAEQSSVHFLEEPSQFEASETKDFPGVVRIIGPLGRGLCTGTVVSPRAVLTAAHCIKNQGAYRIITDWGSYLSQETVSFGNGSVNDSHDIALLIFNERIAKDNQIIPIRPGADVNDSVTLVGFGCNDLDSQAGTNIKRRGRNRIFKRSEYLELATPLKEKDNTRSLLGPENLTGTCFGDSGGPLLRQEHKGTSVAGVVHGGRWNREVTVSLFSDLGNADNFSFLQDIEKRFNLYLTRPCDAPENQLPYCQTNTAVTGIVGLLRWLLGTLAAWFGLSGG